MASKNFGLFAWVATFTINFQAGRVNGDGPKQQFFRTTPQDSFVPEGGRAIINCVIGDLGGRVQWTKDGLTLGYYRELPGFSRYSVLGSDESGVFNLQIINATLEDESVYECQVGPNGTNKPIRANAKLNVLLPPTKAELLGYKSDSELIVREKEEVELICRIHNARPRPDIIWYLGDREFIKGRREDSDDKGSLPERTTVTSILRFKPSAGDNSQNIACEAQHPALTQEPLRASIKMFVQYPPGQPQIEGYRNKQPLKKGDTVTLVCISRGGNPLATITWYRNGQRVDSSYTTILNGSKNTYEFTATEEDNNALYSCQAKNDLIVKPLEAEITTIVQYGPKHVRITGPSEAMKGDELNFECTTSNSNPPVDIWWVVDGRAVQGNHTRKIASERGGWKTMTNITVRVDPSDRNINIQCHAVNQEVADTRVESHTISVLYPPEPPKITGYKEGDVLTGGKMRRIMCTSVGGNPLATIKWYLGSDEIDSEYNVGDNYATATLDLSVNMTDNGAVYRCVVTSKVIAEPMEKSIKTNVKFGPSFVNINVEPNTLRIGEKATLSCESGEANPPSVLVWLLKGEVLSAGKQIFRKGNYGGKTTRSILTVNVKSRDDGEVYTCKAYNDYGEALDAVTLAIAYKPEFPTVSSPVEVIEGEPFVLNISASASPTKLDYKWEKDMGRNLDTSPDSDVWFNGGILHIPKVSKTHAGTYTIRANNSEGMAVTKIKLDVLFPPKITDITQPLLLDSLDDAMFECTFDANPVMYEGIRWVRQEKESDEEVIVSGSSRRISVDWDDISGNTVKSRLIIRNVTVQDAGKIACIFSNGYGIEARGETYLLVKHKPIMDESPALRKAAAANRETGRLVCRAQGSPNITFTWRRQTGELAGGSKYQVYHKMVDPLTWESQFHVLDINPADYGIYECAARNTMGVSYQMVMLDTPSRPDTPSQVMIVSSSSDSVTLKWVPAFDGGSRQTFRVKYYPATSISLYSQGRVIFVEPINETSFTVTGLKSSTKYKFAIQSLNEIGESEYSTPIETVTEAGNNPPLVDGLTDTSSQSVPIIVTISIGVCATLLLLLSVVLITCLVHKRRQKRTTSRSFSSDNSKPSVQDGFSGSQGTSCYNDTMSEETMSYISERSGSFISPQDNGLRGSGIPNLHMMDEGYHPHAASTYLTEHIGGIYSVEQGREIGFTSNNLPLSKNTFTEDTESQYADELRRQAYIQTLGDGYNISQIGSSISYPNSPTAEYYSNDGLTESDLQENQKDLPSAYHHVSPTEQLPHHHHHHFSRPAGNTALIGTAATLGRHSGRFGTGKSPFRVVVPSNPAVTPPVCSTPQNSLPILDSLETRERVLPEFSTFGNQSNGFVPKQRNEPIEPSGHLV